MILMAGFYIFNQLQCHTRYFFSCTSLLQPSKICKLALCSLSSPFQVFLSYSSSPHSMPSARLHLCRTYDNTFCCNQTTPSHLPACQYILSEASECHLFEQKLLLSSSQLIDEKETFFAFRRNMHIFLHSIRSWPINMHPLQFYCTF